jgi:heme-degrading monooxygenase HmoA
MKRVRRFRRAFSVRFLSAPDPTRDNLPLSFLNDQPPEEAMIAKIIIKRRFVKENTPQILSLLNKMRSIAMDQTGYISGETLMQKDFPENMAVIATWQRMEDWLAWKDSEERKTYEAMLEIYQTRPTQYEEYHLGTSFLKK